MRLTWWLWKQAIRRVARSQGFLDPFAIAARLRAFAQPSEVGAPIELIRAGFAFHARGLMNTRAIQNNLDWHWPYWVVRQFDPADVAFIPRSFSITHVNLTHRNWTAIGVPECHALPIVDPRGMVTPHLDGWSLISCVFTENGMHQPAKAKHAKQELLLESDRLAVRTHTEDNGASLISEAEVIIRKKMPICQIAIRASSNLKGWLAISLRPFNPEGVAPVDAIALAPNRRRWLVNGKQSVAFDTPPVQHAVSSYREGDALSQNPLGIDEERVACDVGMATAVAVFPLEGNNKESEVRLRVPLRPDPDEDTLFPGAPGAISWQVALEGTARLSTPDTRIQNLYDAAIRSLILHSPKDVYPGPYTYKRFWFRDAALILNAMIGVGMFTRAHRAIEEFPKRQDSNGYFRSQEGEWDSNGEVLWIIHRYIELSGDSLGEEWRDIVKRAARWIARKRLSTQSEELYAGLMPAGFSAEHLGNNDYYYWDDYWSVAGLCSASALCANWGDRKACERFQREATSMKQSIMKSLKRSHQIRNFTGLPASPCRRMDAGSVGSLVAGYPLQLLEPRDEQLLGTVAYLQEHSFYQGAFFQEMIHSGINPYLSLHVAQVLLRARDAKYFDIINRVAELASPTGQWPEAIHPRTGGGCMGDGQHVWAAAEWVMMIRHLFVREEGQSLILGEGLPREWWENGEPLSYGPAQTPWGCVEIHAQFHSGKLRLAWSPDWRNVIPLVRIAVPGLPEREVKNDEVREVEWEVA